MGLTRGAVLVVAMIAACSRDKDPEVLRLLRDGAFERIASTKVADDVIEFWQKPPLEDPSFGPFVIVARDSSGRLLDFCRGVFRSSARPYAQSDRYCALVAATANHEDAFFIYDAHAHRFFTRVPPPQAHVHDGFLFVGDRILFASCKTPEPLWMLDLKTGEDISLGRDAPQAAELYAVGSTVLVVGEGHVFELVGEQLRPTLSVPTDNRTPGFDLIRR